MRTPSILFAVAMFLAMSCTSSASNPATRPSDDPGEAAERRTLYYPSPYEAGDVGRFIESGGVRLDYHTDQGKQTAWLIKPANNAKTDRLWLVAGGNATLALQLVPTVRKLAAAGDAFVLVDYPGYGECAGKPDPGSIRENVKQSLIAAGKKVGIDPAKDPDHVLALGHSMGCSAALMAVEEFHLKSAVLCSPYTSTHEMAELRFGMAKDAPMYHQMDNRPGLAELAKNHGHAWIFHGDDDRVVPVAMSKTLAAEFKSVVKLTVVKGAGHNDIFEAAGDEIAKAMAAAGK